MKIILASSSPRRKELFKLITTDFTVISSDIEEVTPGDMPAEGSPKYLAEQKALEISLKYPDDLIIGCDTSVITEHHILDKPKDNEEAIKMLKLLSGKTHKVITGCCIIYKGRKHIFQELTEVEFYTLDDIEIDQYVKTREPFDKAGGYGIQGKGALFVKRISGDYYNVMGLPVAKLKREMSNFLLQNTAD